MVHGWWCLLHEGKILGTAKWLFTHWLESLLEQSLLRPQQMSLRNMSTPNQAEESGNRAIFSFAQVGLGSIWSGTLSQALFGNWNRGISSSMSSESLTPSGTSAPSATETTSLGPLSEKHAKLCVLPILDSCQNASLPSFIPSYLHSLCFLYSSCNPKTPTLP